MLLLSNLILGFNAQQVSAQGVFPDKALEKAVRQEVYAKRNNEEPITADDVKNISQVVARGKEIQNLEGLQHCVALAKIELPNNKIVDLNPIRGLKQLQSVDLSGNQIESIEPLTELLGIQYLELSKNKVTDLAPLKKMSNMQSLYLSENQIKLLEPVSELKKIHSLYVAGNPVEDWAVVGKLKWLSNFDARGCKLKDLAFLKSLTSLKFLLVNDNGITDLAPLVEMCVADAAGDKQFAMFLEFYLSGNPLTPGAKNEQLAKLKEIGVRVHTEPIKK